MPETTDALTSAQAAQIMQDIYDSETNVMLGWMWDSGFSVKLGDTWNGFIDADNKDTFLEAVAWLRDAVIRHFPDSDFAKKYRALRASPPSTGDGERANAFLARLSKLPMPQQALAREFQSVREDEREACAKAQCSYCREGWPFVEGGAPIHETTTRYGDTMRGACRAAAIRQRGTTP